MPFVVGGVPFECCGVSDGGFANGGCSRPLLTEVKDVEGGGGAAFTAVKPPPALTAVNPPEVGG